MQVPARASYTLSQGYLAFHRLRLSVGGVVPWAVRQQLAYAHAPFSRYRKAQDYRRFVGWPSPPSMRLAQAARQERAWLHAPLSRYRKHKTIADVLASRQRPT